MPHSALRDPQSALRSGFRQAWDALENPVMGREFRARMRGARSYWITGCYTLVVMACVMIVYFSLEMSAEGKASNRVAAEVGRGIWTWGCLAQALLLPLMVPAFTCGAITLERERDLLELLLLTPQSVPRILLGKLASGVGLGLMLVLSSVPVLALSLLLGGVSPMEITACLLVLVSAVVLSGTLGLAASALAPRTVTATTAVYLIVGFGMIGLPLILALLGAANSLQGSDSGTGILAVLGACMVAAFPPALALAFLFHALRRRLTETPPPRVWWIATVGFSWCFTLLFIYLPGMNDVFLQGQSLVLLLHPVVAILSVMDADTGRMGLPMLASSWGSSIAPYLWYVCTLAYGAGALWLFLVAVLRVRRFRAG